MPGYKSEIKARIQCDYLLLGEQLCIAQAWGDIYYMAAQIFIKIDKPFYFAGDTIQGEVYFSLYEPMNANEVLVKFKGWEEAKWIDEEDIINEQERANIAAHLIFSKEPHLKMDTTDSSSEQGEEQYTKFQYCRYGDRIKRFYKRSGGRVIVKTTNVLHNFGGQFIPPGQYVFPFSYKTGEDFPASFTKKSSDRKSKGRIKYEMRVFIRGFSHKRRLLKHNTEIVIRETTVIQNQKQEIVANVKSCCTDKGVCKIQCHFDKNGYMPGEEAKIYCMIDNRGCVVDIRRVTVKLINSITYTSKDNHQKFQSYTLFTNEFPGLPAGGEIQRDKSVRIVNSNSSPEDIMPTARGERVKSVYFLRVQAEVNASCTCCGTLPVVDQPIVIYPFINVNYMFNKPSNWNPLMMPAVNLQQAITAVNQNLQNMANPYY